MSSSLRQRKPAGGQEPAVQRSEAAPKKPGCPVNLNKGWRGWLRKAVVILIPAYTICVMYGVLEPPKPLMMHAWDDILLSLNSGERMYTPEELESLSIGNRPMLSILGEVFDVSKGKKYYGKNGAYRGFVGRDASRAFITGDFSEEGLTDDVSRLEPSQCLGLKDWLEFYHKESANYMRRGILQGRFYDEKGRATSTLRAFQRCAEQGQKDKDKEEAEKKLYPTCNSRWSAAEGGRVWCEDPSKVPRKVPSKRVHGTGVRSAGSGGSGEHKPHAGQAGGLGAGHGSAVAVEDEQDTRDAVKVQSNLQIKAFPEQLKATTKAKGRCACFDPEYAKANENRLLSYGRCPPESNSCDTKPPEPPRAK